MEPTRLPDPFAIQTDPQLYVPRRATEEALDALERAVSSPHAVVRFTGPPGLGKTLLLHVLAAELAPHFRTAYLPYARLPAAAIWAWVAEQLALEPVPEAKEALRSFIGQLAAEGRALLLEIDDASSLPADALDELGAFARAEPGLRVVLAFSEGERPTEPRPGDGPLVRLHQPMSRSETQDYVKARLERCAAPGSLIDRFDTATVARLHRESMGNPLRLHGLAVGVMREAEKAPAAIAEGGAAASELRAGSLAPPDEGSEQSASPPPERAEPIPAPLVERADPVPAPPDERAEEVPSPPAKQARLRKRRAAPRSRARSPRDSRRRLARVLFGAAGFCIGFVTGVGLGRWAAGGFGVADLAGRETQVAAPVSPAPPPPGPVRAAPEPAPPASAPELAPAPAVAAAPPPSDPAPADASPSGAGAAPAAPVPEAAPREGAGEMPASDPASRPLAEPSPPPPPISGAAAPARSEAAAPEPPAAPIAAGRLAIQADAEVMIEIDGRPLGAAPLSGIRLPRGLHRVIAHYRDGAVGLKTVYLGDEDVSITFR